MARGATARRLAAWASLLLGVAGGLGCSTIIGLKDVPPLPDASPEGSICVFDGDSATNTLDRCVFK